MNEDRSATDAIRASALDEAQAYEILRDVGREGLDVWFQVATPAVRAAVESAMNHRLSDAVATIFQYSGSPIERMFFLALLLVGRRMFGPIGVAMCAPMTLNDIRGRHQHIREWERILTMFTQLPDANELMLAAKVSPDPEAQRAAKDYFYDVVLAGQNAINVVLQPRVEHLRIRPDAIIFDQKSDVILVIECDGFEYHSDRAHFVSDRSRDRALLREGLTPVRFAGSEIHADPIAVATEIAKTVLTIREDSPR